MLRKLKWDEEAVSFLDEDLLLSLSDLMVKKFSVYLKKEFFEVEALKTDDWVQVRQTLRNKSGSFAYPIEVLAPVDENSEEHAAEVADVVFDFLDVYWKAYLSEDRETLLPIDWSTHELSGRTLYVRGTPRNLEVEKMADDFLKEHGMGGYDVVPLSMET
jgi:hypothetical protein